MRNDKQACQITKLLKSFRQVILNDKQAGQITNGLTFLFVSYYSLFLIVKCRHFSM